MKIYRIVIASLSLVFSSLLFGAAPRDVSDGSGTPQHYFTCEGMNDHQMRGSIGAFIKFFTETVHNLTIKDTAYTPHRKADSVSRFLAAPEVRDCLLSSTSLRLLRVIDEQILAEEPVYFSELREKGITIDIIAPVAPVARVAPTAVLATDAEAPVRLARTPSTSGGGGSSSAVSTATNKRGRSDDAGIRLFDLVAIQKPEETIHDLAVIFGQFFRCDLKAVEHMIILNCKKDFLSKVSVKNTLLQMEGLKRLTISPKRLSRVKEPRYFDKLRARGVIIDYSDDAAIAVNEDEDAQIALAVERSLQDQPSQKRRK